MLAISALLGPILSEALEKAFWEWFNNQSAKIKLVTVMSISFFLNLIQYYLRGDFSGAANEQFFIALFSTIFTALGWHKLTHRPQGQVGENYQLEGGV